MTRTLLLADPSPVIQGLVERGLPSHEFELLCAGSGDDALALARSRRPDLILAEVTLAGLDGYQLCEAIKESPELHGVPVLLLSGAFGHYDPQRALESRADGHLQKPFESETLIDRVTEVLPAVSTEKPLESARPEDLLEPTLQGELIEDELILGDELDFEESTDLLEILPLPKDEQLPADPLDELFDFGDSEPETSLPASKAAGPGLGDENRTELRKALEEKAAAALADYPEAVIEALIERVEAIAWEVIPQMAETLIREEIRRMKEGEE